jgi:copper transport protein
VHARAHVTVRAAALLALVAGLWLGLLAPQAAAHALLIRADPAINGTVASPPQQILLTFTEPVDPTLSHAQVVDTQGRPVPGALPSKAVPGNSEQLLITLRRPLPHSVYTVDWQTVSALDGHYVTGAYAFGVGVADVGKVAPFGKYVSTSPWLTGTQAAGRWLLWAGLALLLGASCVYWFVWRGRLPAGGPALLWLGWLLAAVGVSTVILTERAIVRAPSLLPLIATPEGYVLLGQAAAVLVACGLAVYAAAVLPHRATMATLGAAAGLAMLAVV